MPLSVALKAQADEFLDDVDIQLISLQKSYFDDNGRYCQLPATHDTIPEDGIAVATKENKKIDGYPSWNKLGVNLPATCKACAQVHVYNGPNWQGYVIIGDIKYKGVHYKSGRNIGLETWKDTDWMEIIPSTAGV